MKSRHISYKLFLLLTIFAGLELLSSSQCNSVHAAQYSYHKNGHLWYKGQGKSGFDAEVMNGTYKYDPTSGRATYPKNKTKHYKLYKVNNLPIMPNHYATRAIPASIAGWDSLFESNKLQFDGKKYFSSFPKQMTGKNYSWYNVYKNAYVRSKGTAFAYPINDKSLGTINATIYKTHVADSPYLGDTIYRDVLPTNVKPTDPSIRFSHFNFPLNKGINQATLAYYFGDHYQSFGTKLGATQTGGTITFRPTCKRHP